MGGIAVSLDMLAGSDDDIRLQVSMGPLVTEILFLLGRKASYEFSDQRK